MGPVIKREELERVVEQINKRFDYFTQKVESLEKKLEATKPKNTKEKVNG